MLGTSRRTSIVLMVLAALSPGLASAAKPDPSAAAEQPDPAAVRRYGPAYRYPRAGWTVLHIEGAPYERGYQHGRLLASEIADYALTLATKRSHTAPADAWRETRTMVNALFLRRYDKEYLEEMKGIADGSAAAGARLLGRPIDFLDVVAINSDIELEFLDAALEATPTGLEGKKFREPADLPATPTPPEHCSAFAATGPATADGKIVFGHITMFSLTFVRHFNVWLDVKPEQGHRVMMQTYPGGIQSGMDYYLNDAGLLVAETTVKQTKFDVNGLALASRIRKALQYADSIDQAVTTLKEGNNGMYTNEWLLADVKTNEIAMFELGTHKSKLWRSSKEEWFGGAPGFYWGCNNAKDLNVRLETIAAVNDRPANLVWRPADRDKAWLRLYDKHKGKIAESFGFEAFTTPPLSAFPSLDAKFTTSALAKDLKTWAVFGPPLGKVWEPSEAELRKYADAKPLVPNDWTVLTAEPPPPVKNADKFAAKAEADGSLRRHIDRLKATRHDQRLEVEKLRKTHEDQLTKIGDSDPHGLKERQTATLDAYRRWSEELTNVEIRRISSKAKLDQLRQEKSSSSRPLDEKTLKAATASAFDDDPRAQSIKANLRRAEDKLPNIERLSRNANDPAVVLARQKVQRLAEEKAQLFRALEPSIRRRLSATAIDAAESIARAIQNHENALRGKLEDIRIESRNAESDGLKLEFARGDLQRAEAVLDKIDRSLEQLVPRSRGAHEPVDLPHGSIDDKTNLDNAAGTIHPPAWHGTLLPESDADTWLAAAFADYQTVVARELAFKKKAKGRDLNASEKDAIEVALFSSYSSYKTAVVRLGKDVPLRKTHAEFRDDAWYQIASGKGVLLLAALRARIGDDAFLDALDEFGRAHAGKAVSTDQFVAALEAKSKVDLKSFFEAWLTKIGLPSAPKWGSWSIDSFEAEPEQAVIVYGTLKESDAQREAASRLQRQIERRWSNITAPILADRDATDEALKGRHVLLVGRPDTNSIAAKLGKDLPVTFGPTSFVVRGSTYAHPHSAVIAASARPDDPRHEVVLFAGLGGEATWRCVTAAGDRSAAPAEVLILPASGVARRLAVNPSEKTAGTGQAP